jgi:hypothetical protein
LVRVCSEEARGVSARLEGDADLRRRVEEVRRRGAECKRLLQDTSTTEGWTLVSEAGGLSTFYQPADGDGKSVRIRVEGGMDLPLIAQVGG